jgi:hypothetical protein
MKTGWPYDAGTFEIGDWPDEQLADRAAGRPHRPLEAPAGPVNGAATRAKTTARAESFPGEQAMADQQRSVPFRAEPAAVRSCWMCGIRLSADQMLADGGSACLDLRWYCRDTWACTERWTWRSASSAAIGQGTAETPKKQGKQATGTDAARPVPV